MANRYPEGSPRENGPVGGVQSYGPEGRGEGATTRESGERGSSRYDEGGRFYRAALSRSDRRDDERGRDSRWRDDESWRRGHDRERDWSRQGEGWRANERGELRDREHWGRDEERPGERWGRGADWRGTDRYEHGRSGFDDFGTPSYGQGREMREQYSDRDFQGRDDRYAGRSGMSYAEGTQERGRTRERKRGRLWEREPATAREIMTPNPKAVRRDATLRDVAQIMRDENCGVVPVCDDNQRLVGLITDRDMVMRSFEAQKPWTAFKVGEVMTDEVEAVTPETPVRELIQLMGRKQVRRVPVVDRNDRLVGMIAMADVATRANEDDDLQEALDRISKRRSFWSRLWS
ncbi:MAG TPA: CBS domain-containing protein [Myxococcaceae bacterium]|nr:CBS domain-containing protein [Myxococcaceae bacterium]